MMYKKCFDKYGGVFLEGNIPRENSPRGNLTKGNFPRGSSPSTTREQLLKFDITKVFTSTFLSWNPIRCFNLIKALIWFEADLQMLLMWLLKFSLS